jgi:hypothetical protein
MCCYGSPNKRKKKVVIEAWMCKSECIVIGIMMIMFVWVNMGYYSRNNMHMSGGC